MTPDLAFFLDPVITNRRCRIDGAVQIFSADFAFRALRIVGRMPEPDAGIAIRLQLQSHRGRPRAAGLASLLHPRHGAGQVLHVVPEIVRQDGRFRGVTAPARRVGR